MTLSRPFRALPMLLCVVVLLAAPTPAAAWSDSVYRLVIRKAIDTLPKEQKKFFEAHRFEMPSLVVDEDAPAKPEGRRFAVDVLESFPFTNVPRDEAGVGERAKGVAVGRLPFLILETHGRLVEAFKSGDKVRILQEADAIAILAADLNNPLLLTDNSDGQKTGQPGLGQRFTVRLPESMEGRLKLSPEAARLLDNPKSYIFGSLARNYVWVDNLLYLDDLAHRGKSSYDGIYYESMELRSGKLLGELLSNAAADAGSFWYTAWTEAGRPELK